MLNKIRTAILSSGIISTALLSHPVLANDAVGYCKLHTTAGWIGKGKCKVHTGYKQDVNSIMVSIKEPWTDGNKFLLIKLSNNPKCKDWRALSDICHAEYMDDQAQEFSPLVAFILDQKGFLYSFGHGYTVYYQGMFPNPSQNDYSGHD